MPRKKHSELELEIPARIPLAELLQRLNVPAGEVALVVINGEQVELKDAYISDQDRVQLFPPIGGGNGSRPDFTGLKFNFGEKYEPDYPTETNPRNSRFIRRNAYYGPIDVEQWLHMYEQMLKIRYFEDTVNDLYKTARMPGLAHLYSGEEAVAVGVCEALKPDDYITSTHRGHGHCLAKGARSTGCLPSCSAKQPVTARAKAARCISPIRIPATWAPMRSSQAAAASPPERPSPAKCANPAR